VATVLTCNKVRVVWGPIYLRESEFRRCLNVGRVLISGELIGQQMDTGRMAVGRFRTSGLSSCNMQPNISVE